MLKAYFDLRDKLEEVTLMYKEGNRENVVKELRLK